jgi:hypothetical protein
VYITDEAAERFEQTFSQAMPTRDEIDIEISHSHGNITMKGWEKEEVVLEGQKIVRARDRETARLYAEQMKVEIKSKGDRIFVRTIRPEPDPAWQIRQITINYELYAPKRLNVTLKNEHGNVVIESFQGKLDTNSRHGNLQIAHIGKDASIQHEHGNVEVTEIGGDASVEKRHGVLTLKSVGGELKLTHEHGNVEVVQIGKRADLTKRHGSLNVVDVGGAVQLEHEHGNVHLKQIQDDVDTQKAHGNVEVEGVNGNFTLSSEHSNLNAVGIAGDVYWRGAHGNAHIENVSGAANIVRSHGNIELHNVKGAVSVKNAHSSVEVISSQPITQPYLLHTEHGNLRLAIPERSNVELLARTEHGRIHSNLPLSIMSGRHNAMAEGRINDGGTTIELSTRHGNIAVEGIK